jgi:RNA polymerase sigma-70 factor (ECF subfamily)
VSTSDLKLATPFQAMADAPPSHESAIRGRLANIYQTHREEVYRFVAGQGLPPSAAQDVTQDVFLKLYYALKDGSDIALEQAWLYKVAARSAIDYWRRARRVLWIEFDADPTLPESIPSEEAAPDSRIATAQRLRRVSEEMRSLPKEQRLCIHLRSQGLRYREIAELLGVGVSTAANWLNAAVDRLRRAAHE